MISEAAAWAIFFVPLGSFVITAFIIRPFFNKQATLAGYLAIAAIGTSFVLSLWALGSLINGEGEIIWESHPWISVGNFEVNLGILMDPLTAIMLTVVTGVSLLIQVYSVGYMKGDPGYARYYAYMSIFTASMIGLVLASNIIQLFVFWELVGLSSYLLIGFWYHRPAAAAAAKKAFIVTRLGDFGFLLGIMYLYFNSDVFTAQGLNPLDIPDIYTAISAGLITSGVATWIAVGIFAGAVGKSGQFPLHTWLPDAMEGPTPVSALIHAATMVAAGVFLVARFFPLFQLSTTAMNSVAIIGGFTAIFAASMGLVMNDIKRVLAYSTVSQLGYMMLALGVGAYGAAIFHLFTHAFFKALLFLGSGSVNHATGTFDMRYMGGLRKVMPWTYATFVIGSLSLAGVFPLAGFWSKDEILGDAWNEQQILFWLALGVVFLTAFYMFRAIFMTFEGEYQGGAEPEEEGHGGDEAHPHESPWVMVLPLAVLAVPAVLIGFANISGGVEHLLAGALPDETAAALHPFKFSWGIALGSSAVALAGIGGAWLFYGAKVLSAERVRSAVGPLHTLLERKYFLDDLYEGLIVRRILIGGVAAAAGWFDTYIVDGIANGVATTVRASGDGLRLLQTGQVQVYGAIGFAGVLIAGGLAFLLNPL
ncbi:MAG: NADH-quinone oxidoreductase subunit L [Chloroflexi bacterium]|nr:NADH-quinone oxidoreductase subunit L [Chloroflexota bacterium]